jgi:hypothetical protein
MKFYLLLLLFVVLSCCVLHSQPKDIIVGKTEQFTTASVYNLSDPQGVNMEVNLWGFVRYPGRYIVPVSTTLVDLITFAGGPDMNSNLEEIRLLRPANDSTLQKSQVMKFNYDDLLWQQNVKLDNKSNPRLQAGDVILILEQKRFTFRDDVGFYLPILTSLITIATFIVTVTRN